MTVKRNRITIIKDILEVIQEKQDKARPTHILYKANLSNEMLNEYLSELMSKKLIEEMKDKAGKKTYTLTDKGHKFIADYNHMLSFLNAYDLDS